MEFDLISRYFKEPFADLVQSRGESVLAGIGDDCAALKPTLNHTLYISTDTLVEGVHFFSDDSAHGVGWKSLACNLSDLAACGATPLGFTLNLSLPSVDENWLSGFSGGLLDLAAQENCPLVGGDTTSAGSNTAKTISITVFGQAPAGHNGFHRAHALAGDEVWVSGTPGLARLGLLLQYQRVGQLAACCKQSELMRVEQLLAALPDHLKQRALNALQQPVTRIRLGQQLHGLANACVDLSDGLGGDIGHIANSSGLMANLSVLEIQAMWLEYWPELARSPDALELLGTLVSTTLQGGDDFELCWVAKPAHHNAIQSIEPRPRRIGTLQQGEGVWLSREKAGPERWLEQSYNHFAEPRL
ncbi:MAG: thiamine-phosphate kinase [Limnobacter sp.]|uniref:thiamine-phosphate kinase n=1 Tax=Limnobacter sp. TaxID=2003368 RepID=UPI0032EB111D